MRWSRQDVQVHLLAEQVAVAIVGCAFLQLIDPFLKRMDALVVLLHSLQQRDHKNTQKGKAAAADQFQQHATSKHWPMLT